MRGCVFVLNGLSLFVFGGAQSHDISGGILRAYKFQTEKAFKSAYKKLCDSGISFRVDHFSWWEQELPSDDEMERGFKNLSEHNWKVNYVVTHCAPTSIATLAGFQDKNQLTQYFEQINEKLDFRKWFFGHYHENRQILDKHVMLYEQIIRIQ